MSWKYILRSPQHTDVYEKNKDTLYKIMDFIKDTNFESVNININTGYSCSYGPYIYSRYYLPYSHCFYELIFNRSIRDIYYAHKMSNIFTIQCYENNYESEIIETFVNNNIQLLDNLIESLKEEGVIDIKLDKSICEKPHEIMDDYYRCECCPDEEYVEDGKKYRVFGNETFIVEMEDKESIRVFINKKSDYKSIYDDN